MASIFRKLAQAISWSTLPKSDLDFPRELPMASRLADVSAPDLEIKEIRHTPRVLDREHRQMMDD